MRYEFTPAAARALAYAARATGAAPTTEVRSPALLLALAAEPECRAAILLRGCGIDTRAIVAKWPQLKPPDTSNPAAPPNTPGSGDMPLTLPPLAPEAEQAIEEAARRMAEYADPVVLATEHLLLGLAAVDHPVANWLFQHGLHLGVIEEEIAARCGHRPGPLPMDFEDEDNPTGGGRQTGMGHVSNMSEFQRHVGNVPHVGNSTLRTLDAAANRGREGLRVVEDYVRFVLDDRHLTEVCKQLRHDLAAALARIPSEHRLAARETQADVGTTVSTPSEQQRASLSAVVAANLARLQESLRSLEEFGKLVDPALAAAFEQLRYRSYTLHRAVEITRTGLDRLRDAKLYVLVDGRKSPAEFEQLARGLVDAGVDVLQLRDKRLADRELLARARLLREITAGTATLLIVNDRPDLAVLARADGVHVGQEELSVKDARSIVGPAALIGVSTHSLDQARQAVHDGANYIGVGPTFPSGTKTFDHFPGLDLLREVAAEIRLPSFAIGGITAENLPEVLATGMSRVAVSGAVTDAAEPADVAKVLRSRLFGESAG